MLNSHRLSARAALPLGLLLALTATHASAQDVSVTPPPGGGFSVGADGATPLLQVDADGTVAVPALGTSNEQTGVLCFGSYGVLGPCAAGSIVGPAGPAGPPGPQGETGPAGPQGEAGPIGPIGQTGLTGPAGPAGETGPAGPTGAAGPEGPQGPIGAQGIQGPTGDPGPIGPPGETGPIGPSGPAGPQGNPGPAGVAGPPGPTGETGPSGPEGPVGPTGPAGAIGPAGPAGPVGAVGPQGEIGAVGPAGPIGPAGPQGVAGPVGATGAVGATGPAGPTGATGPAGPAGADGTIYTIGDGLALDGTTLSLQTAGCTADQVLQFDGVDWDCATPASGPEFSVLVNGQDLSDPATDIVMIGTAGTQSAFLTAQNYGFTISSGSLKPLWLSFDGPNCTGTTSVSFDPSEPSAQSQPGQVFRNGNDVYYVAFGAATRNQTIVSYRDDDAAGTCLAFAGSETGYPYLPNNPAVTGYSLPGNPNNLDVTFTR